MAVSKADYPYPPDEFDAPPGPDAPRGVHRAPRSWWSRWWPFLVVLVVVPALAWAAVTWYLRDDSSTPTSPTTGVEETVPADETATDEATEPADGQTTAEAPPTTEAPAPAVNLAAPVAVLNGAKISGLAAREAEKLEAAGFTAVTPDNFTGTSPAASTVFYASADLQPTAQLVGTTLGIATVVESAVDAGAGITVVLRSDPDA
jgi:cytoskeletal protein RodZ